jgi:hypothetical protein
MITKVLPLIRCFIYVIGKVFAIILLTGGGQRALDVARRLEGCACPGTLAVRWANVDEFVYGEVDQ